eukprot:4135646-Pyramimonas_sp.AAC.1
MKTGKQPGEDGFVAEALRFGGDAIRQRVFALVKQMWKLATEGEEGEEAAGWPDEWRSGIVVPLWKKKGNRADKNTWRGITLLSVGSKLLARVVASRVSQWSE